MIWTITAYGPEEPFNNRARRVFGYYLSSSEAVDAIAHNAGSMHECLYTHLVVEGVPPGIHAPAEVGFWWYWDQDAWHPCEAPEWSVGVCNHSMG